MIRSHAKIVYAILFVLQIIPLFITIKELLHYYEYMGGDIIILLSIPLHVFSSTILLLQLIYNMNSKQCKRLWLIGPLTSILALGLSFFFTFFSRHSSITVVILSIIITILTIADSVYNNFFKQKYTAVSVTLFSIRVILLGYSSGVIQLVVFILLAIMYGITFSAITRWDCPKCGKVNKIKARFCIGCGTVKPTETQS